MTERCVSSSSRSSRFSSRSIGDAAHVYDVAAHLAVVRRDHAPSGRDRQKDQVGIGQDPSRQSSLTKLAKSSASTLLTVHPFWCFSCSLHRVPVTLHQSPQISAPFLPNPRGKASAPCRSTWLAMDLITAGGAVATSAPVRAPLSCGWPSDRGCEYLCGKS